MRLEFHRLIASDISTIMTYYEDVGGPKLAEEFYSELRQFFQKAANNPEAYSIRERDLRRVNLETFPYHFLFRMVNDCVRVLVVRHHSRRPALGVESTLIRSSYFTSNLNADPLQRLLASRINSCTSFAFFRFLLPNERAPEKTFTQAMSAFIFLRAGGT